MNGSSVHSLADNVCLCLPRQALVIQEKPSNAKNACIAPFLRGGALDSFLITSTSTLLRHLIILPSRNLHQRTWNLIFRTLSSTDWECRPMAADKNALPDLEEVSVSCPVSVLALSFCCWSFWDCSRKRDIWFWRKMLKFVCRFLNFWCLCWMMDMGPADFMDQGHPGPGCTCYQEEIEQVLGEYCTLSALHP